jgi:hypothetical protein
MKTISKNLALGMSLLIAGTGITYAQPAQPAQPANLTLTNPAAPRDIWFTPPPLSHPGAAGATNGPLCVTPATNGLGPRIRFAIKEADFGRVKKGELVKYTYVFTNVGDAVLHVPNVAPGCGCTHAGDWTKVVEPGNTGTIPIQLATVNFNGPVTKFVNVSCDDKTQSSIQLQLKGTIWSPIEVNPQYVNFTIPADAPGGSALVNITNNTAEPLYLTPPHCNNPAFQAELRTNTPGRGYQMVISRVPPLAPGQQQTIVTMTTSFSNTPPIQIVAWANVQAPLTILPMQLTLPQAPLSNPHPFTITIQNQTTNMMVLSEPAIGGKDVKIELRELQPGHYFNALLTFPDGFELARGEQLQFSVKSSLPNHPLIEVPIMQIPRPAVAPPPMPQPAVAPRVLPAPAPPRADAR